MNPYTRLVILLALLIGAINSNAQYSNKIPLKVLYVGYDPQKPMPSSLVYYSTDTQLYPEIYKTRMPDFKSFLERKFTNVQVVDARDYNVVMSDKVDVTIIDAGPISLPEDFNRPTILIAAMAPNVGKSIGLKFDWYCQCLDNDALNIKTQHEIFNTPNKVNLTLTNKPTPSGFFNGHQGASLPKEMPMWEVVSEKKFIGKKYLIGMVSHGEGFNDSPDAEVISGGYCLKNAEAVALGRHGNYFMWGFAGSPDYMTEEAKLVFVNAISYIKRFDGKSTIVKKTQIETRTSIDEIIYRIDESLYHKTIVARKEGNERMKKMQQELKKQKAAGKDIGFGNEMFLKMPVTDASQSFEEYLKVYAGSDLFKRFGTDTKSYHNYFKENYEYFYPSGAYSLQLDNDAKKLGMSNRNLEILEKCISMLEKNQDTELALRVLNRYTMEKFGSAQEWRAWFNKKRDSLFFTESGGFKFMVNTYSKTASAIVNKSDEMVDNQGELPTIEDPVSVSARLIPRMEKNVADLIIDARILEGWHIYALVSEGNPFIATEPIVELPEGVKLVKEWESSSAIPDQVNQGVFIFEGKMHFKVAVDYTAVKTGAVIKCGLYYQACDKNKCFLPKKKIIEVKI